MAPLKNKTIFHTQFPPDKLDVGGGEKGKKNTRAKMRELWAGVGGRRLVICQATQCIWFHKLGFVKAEGILVTWGRNKACAPSVEPVAAVVTFMAQEERCWSRETVCGRATAVTEHTAVGLATEMRKDIYFYQGPRTVSCWINKQTKSFLLLLITFRFAAPVWSMVKAFVSGVYLSFIMAVD